jgi:CDP-glycerol glycerophosphotransferase
MHPIETAARALVMAMEPESPAPLISIIMPIYNLEDYLDKCLDAITKQEFKNIEIIAVDGGSTDRSAKILDAKKREDPRFTVITRDRIGPGEARNVGMDEATGEYIWFVDGDDIVASGSLKIIAQRIEQDRPDVLFTNHVRVYPDGHEKPGHDDHLIHQMPESCFLLAEQPQVIELSLVCWNKVINSDFLRSTGLRFSTKWPHEEIPLSCLLLPATKRLGVLKSVCYHYCVLRHESVMNSGDRKRHFTIFDAFEVVLDRIAHMVANRDPALSEQLYCAYFRRAIRHFTSIYDAGATRPRNDPERYIAYSDRREFFERMHRKYLRFEPTGCRLGYSALDLKLRLIRAGAYHRYSLMQPVNRLRIQARRRLLRQA